MQFRDYSFGFHTLGEGFSSVVYKARKYKSKQQFAIKFIKEDFLKAEFEKNLLSNQIRVHQLLGNKKNVVSLIQHGKCGNNYALVMQLCQKGSLAEFLQKEKVLSEAQAIYIIKQVINAYRELYRMKILHRDIKPANILITAKNQIKLCDFGLSMKVQDSGKNSTMKIGTACFMAPQIVKQNIYTYKADIWAMGVTFFRMLAGQLPFKSQNYENFLKQVKQTEIQKLLPSSVSEVSRNFLISALNINHQQRMSTEQLLNFSFQSQISPHTLTPSVSQRDVRMKENTGRNIQKSKRTNLDKTISYTNTPSNTLTIKKLNLSSDELKKTQCTESSQTHQISIIKTERTAFKQQLNGKGQLNGKRELNGRRQLNDQANFTGQFKKEQEVLNKQSQKMMLRQMQKVTKILMNRIDFIRYQAKIINLLKFYFQKEFSSLTKIIQQHISASIDKLNEFEFVQKDKMKNYGRCFLFREWISLIQDCQNRFYVPYQSAPLVEDLQKQVIEAIKQIYIEFDKSLRTKTNAGKLITLDYLICLSDLFMMNRKGEEYFLKQSLLHVIMQGFQTLTIRLELIDQIFKGITQKIVDHRYF